MDEAAMGHARNPQSCPQRMATAITHHLSMA